MIYNMSGTAIPSHLAYAGAIQAACVQKNFPPCVAYAVAWRETISGEVAGLWVPHTAASIISGDFGYGLYQLTSPFTHPWPPADWQDPATNALYACEEYLVPGMKHFAKLGMTGDGLIRCIAAGFNSGIDTAWQNHLEGNVDLGTTGNDYASSVLNNYHRLITGEDPQ